MTQVIFNVNSKAPLHALTRLQLLLRAEALTEWLVTHVEPYLKARAKARFSGQGDDVVGRWAPLTPYTIMRRLQDGFGAGPINVQTGELKRFITEGQFIAGWPAEIATLRFPSAPPSGELRTKFQTAQKGRVAPRTPARPVIGVGIKDSAQITTMLALHIQSAGEA